MNEKYGSWQDGPLMIDSEHAPGGVIVYYADGDEEIIHVNQYVIDLFECESADEFLDLVQGSFRYFVHHEDINSAEDSIWGQVEKHDNLDHITYRIKTKNGRLVNVDDYGRLVGNTGGRPVFYVFVIELMPHSAADWLTGLPSMMRFHELARMGADAIRGRGDRPVAVALDLVGLKSFNTQFGRDEGDTLLCEFADVLRKHFGSEACSRFGEDHFYAFAADTYIDELLDSVFEDFGHANDGKVLPIRAGAYACDGEDDIIEGLDRAKIACDFDRKTWHSHLMWFSDEMRARERLRIHVLRSVDQAIEEGWVRPYYQSVVNAQTGEVCNEEALARWIDPEFGPLSPAQFIPVLEEADLLQKVDLHIIDCVIADMATKRSLGVPVVPVSVNISLRDLREVELTDEIVRRMDAAGLSHDLLHVEFLESAASDDPLLLNDQVVSLHNAGFEVWMDDFGSGYSSLNTLHEFDFDVIKLDMEFVRDIGNEKARDIVAAIIGAAKKLGVGTLAEGVETAEQAAFLRNMGCDRLQGFFFSKPNPLEVVIYLRLRRLKKDIA